MSLKISCSGASMARTSPLEDCIAALSQAGYDTVDFWLYSYSEKPGAPMLRENWRDWVDHARRQLEDAGLMSGQVHCAWIHGSAIRDDLSWDVPAPVFHRSIEACALLNCRRLIFHPIFYRRRIDSDALRQRLLDINVAWFRALLPTAERFDVEIHLENTFDFAHVQHPGDAGFMCTSASEMLYLTERLNHPLVKLCLDTGHAHISGQDIPDMIRAFGSKLGSLHLNDNYGLIGPIYEDLHLFPGYGSIEWGEVLDALKAAGFSGSLNMEPVGELPRLKQTLRVLQLRTARELLAVMAADAGL